MASTKYGASVAGKLCRASEDAYTTVACYDDLMARRVHPSTATELCSN